MPDDSRAERYREFYKFIATVDAAGLIAALTLRRDLGLDALAFGASMLCFGISVYLCIFGMFWLALNKPGDKWHLWLVPIIFLLTTIGLSSWLVSPSWLVGG
jgi:uncharacterized membrane protein